MQARTTTNAINREALVRRHNVEQRSLDPRSPVSVGNGEFAFTVDLTGLQSFPGSYPVGAEGEHPGTLLGTQAQWGWHSTPAEEDYQLAGSTVLYDSPRGPVPYVDMVGRIVDSQEDGTTRAETWLRANPHRLDLGRIGFALTVDGVEQALTPADIGEATQTLDLWTGIVTSSFTVAGEPVRVTTACHPDRDDVGLRINSPALARGLVVSIAFPYGSESWHNAAAWNSPNAHTTTLSRDTTRPNNNTETWLVARELDGSRYQVAINGSAHVSQSAPHRIRITSTEETPETLDISLGFTPDGTGCCIPRGLPHAPGTPDTDEPTPGTAVANASAAYWPEFWNSGAAVELDGHGDPRASELERRVVLSQYLTAINCAGSLPPQETGLVCNSWRGRFHLEMHWWHAAHFALWNRPELLLPSLRWYRAVLETSRATAGDQGFDGVRWPKQVGPDGRESPSPIGTFLIWQQPHPIYLAELAYRASPSPELLEEFAEVVFESAAFMASFAHRTGRSFELGPPLIPAQESYESMRATLTNPTFELAYWQWALRVAGQWRERLGLDVPPLWREVADGMAAPLVRNGTYQAIDVEPFTIRTDHPSMLCALGFLPQTDLIDAETMRATLKEVLADWDWQSTWGWDYPVMAMTAARLGEPETAVDALLLNAGKNTFLANGHNRQTDALPLYLPGNGGLLAAVALMAAGWDNGPDTHAPGFPAAWTVKAEGLAKAP
ncbi:hypothetical protein V1639_14235 [Pseudarthrobacter sp. J75]|uniref:hypothetical protein n=1 Tax=unclassified Pseudarthrobacter TaxID=2647000 RepID=UPI002E7FC1B7|nr:MULTISPECIES: hypothetical protein [unclassified Pseudarthrobacter]MEE2524225.1 hypothetical protein [Pseudarthrobacter sp. J47]MEE2530178.1 hypothetical protein [Pseudarthrobacter sp. J75]